MTQTYKKKLIEVAIPLEAINAAAAYEKLPGIGAHPRGIHLWWARRPHGAARAILFAQLVDDPSSNPQNSIRWLSKRQKELGFLKLLQTWQSGKILRMKRCLKLLPKRSRHQLVILSL